jgi:hypothetical protein
MVSSLSRKEGPLKTDRFDAPFRATVAVVEFQELLES